MSGETQLGFEELIFLQELNEVYLLLDFISGRPDKHLSALDGMVLDPKDGTTKLSASNVIERVSALRYPPAPPEAQKAQDAAFLLMLKDCLNCVAYPARGLTIAYTIMFTESQVSWLGRLADRVTSRLPGARSRAAEDAKPNRVQLAQRAFPGLIASAASFREVKNGLAWLALVITVLSATFLWQVTYGAQLAARFDEAKRIESDATAKIYAELDRERTSDAAFRQPGDLTGFCNLPAVFRAHPVASGPAPAAASTAASTAVLADEMTSTTRQLCDDYAYRHAVLAVTIDDVSSYSKSWIFRVSGWLLPLHSLCPAEGCAAGRLAHDGRQEDAQSVAAVLAMMTNYMLPILFGLVGTMAALVRGIQDKVTESILAPRDKTLSLIRLPLGMMAGVCVGLFFNPTAMAAQTGGAIASFTLSASSVAFLAGYGAEGFFRMLDTLITRVFSLRDVEPKQTPR